MAQIFKLEIIIGTIIILSSLLTSILLRISLDNKIYFKYFYLYPLSAFLLSLVTIINYYFNSFSKSTVNTLQNVFVIIENVFWGFFFLKFSIERKTQKSYINKIFSLSLLTVLVLLFANKINTPNFKIVAISNLGFTLYCFTYFITIFKTEPKLKITKDPVFWIVTGLLFYSAFSLPLFPIAEYFKINNKITLTFVIISIINLLIIFMHLFFIKGFICLIRLHKV